MKQEAAVHRHSLDRLNTINDSPPPKKKRVCFVFLASRLPTIDLLTVRSTTCFGNFGVVTFAGSPRNAQRNWLEGGGCGPWLVCLQSIGEIYGSQLICLHHRHRLGGWRREFAG